MNQPLFKKAAAAEAAPSRRGKCHERRKRRAVHKKYFI